MQKEKYDTIQLSYQMFARELADTMSKFYPCDVIKGEDRTDFHVKMSVADDFFKVYKDYNGNIQIALYNYERYEKVSSSKRGEIYKKYQTNNMKVPTLKKVMDKINAETRARDELRALERKHKETQRMFLCDVEALKLPVQYHYNTEYYTDDKGNYTQRNTDIKSGKITKNGIQYHFEFCDDGYISQKVSMYYGVNNTIKDFIALSDNSYKSE